MWTSKLLETAAILSQLKAFFVSREMPAFLVGGSIRDSLQGIETRDLDVAVAGDCLALAEELAETLGGTVMSLGQPGRDVARITVPSSDGGRSIIDLSGIEGSISSDLKRRDFTVDAMALPLREWQTPQWQERILDPFDGKGDVAQGVIRTTGPAVFKDDPVRLLRAVRLAAKLGFRIEAATAGLIAEQAHLISSAAGERVRDEFLAILSLDGAKDHLELLDELGLLCCIIPELAPAKGVDQPREHYWDVFDHSLHSVEGVERVFSRREEDRVARVVPWDVEEEHFAEDVSDGHTRRTVLKLGALLHDVAKPQTKMVDATGRTRFLGHHTQGAAMCKEIGRRLRLSNRGVEMVCGMVENHLRPTQMSQGGELPTARAVYRYFRDVQDVAIDTLYLSLADHLAARGPELDMGDWERHVSIITHILEVGTHEQGVDKMPRLITGHDLIGEFGLEPGPLIGNLLAGVYEAQAAGEVDSREKALAWVGGMLGGREG